MEGDALGQSFQKTEIFQTAVKKDNHQAKIRTIKARSHGQAFAQISHPAPGPRKAHEAFWVKDPARKLGYWLCVGCVSFIL
jgi:hypothetical protein